MLQIILILKWSKLTTFCYIRGKFYPKPLAFLSLPLSLELVSYLLPYICPIGRAIYHFAK